MLKKTVSDKITNKGKNLTKTVNPINFQEKNNTTTIKLHRLTFVFIVWQAFAT